MRKVLFTFFGLGIAALSGAMVARAAAPETPPRSGTWCTAIRVPVANLDAKTVDAVLLPDGWTPVGGTTSLGGGLGMANAPMVVACATMGP